MEILTRAIANEYRDRALLLPSNGLQDIEERRKLREELQARCNLTELQAELDRTKAELREAKSGPDYKLLYDQLIEKMLSR